MNKYFSSQGHTKREMNQVIQGYRKDDDANFEDCSGTGIEPFLLVALPEFVPKVHESNI